MVGDGIRESVEAMADFLQQTPQLLFTLALVELQVYEIAAGNGKQRLVVPQIVARTREVTRAVVRVEGEAQRVVQVSVDVPTLGDKPPSVSKRYTLTENDFFDLLSKSVDQSDIAFAQKIIQDVSDRGCIVEWKQATFVVKLADPGGSGQRLTLFIINKQGELHLGWLAGQLKSLNMCEEIGFDFVKDTAQLFKDVGVHQKYHDSLTKPVSLSELRERYNEFSSLFQRTIDQIRQSP